jgi:addiction module HigA family antidote
MAKKPKQLDPIHPGEILAEELMKPLRLSINAVARDLHVPSGRVRGIVRGQRPVTAEMALRLAAYFGTSVELWLNLQTKYDLCQARRIFGPEIERTVRKRPAA